MFTAMAVLSTLRVPRGQSRLPRRQQVGTDRAAAAAGTARSQLDNNRSDQPPQAWTPLGAKWFRGSR